MNYLSNFTKFNIDNSCICSLGFLTPGYKRNTNEHSKINPRDSQKNVSPAAPKILIIRYSSIGDIVLTTPVLRCLKKQWPESVIHFAVKSSFAPVIKANPYIDKLHTFDGNWEPFLAGFKNESFDWILDLHKNYRSWYLKKQFKAKKTAFDKVNFEKWMLVNLKVNKMPDMHLVDRYFDGISSLGIENDGEGCDYFIPDNEKDTGKELEKLSPFVAVVTGGRYYTKQIPPDILASAINQFNRPVVLLGGPEDKEHSKTVMEKADKDVIIKDYTGKTSINGSAAIISKSTCLVTPDTGLMHIGAALKKPVVSVWGNTVPAFGMYPYFGDEEKAARLSAIIENKSLSCRPCSKLGYKSCPKKHFKCMREIDPAGIAKRVKEFTGE